MKKHPKPENVATPRTVVRRSKQEQENSRATRDAFYLQFASNLNAALDLDPDIPRGHGRLAAAARLFNINVITATKWLNGGALPEPYRLPEIAQVLSTTIKQLMSGMPLDSSHYVERHVIIDTHESDQSVLHHWYAPPAGLEALGLPASLRMVRIDTEDMIPFLKPGDFAVYDTSVDQIDKNGVYVLNIDGRCFLRRIQRDRAKPGIRLACDNSQFIDEACSTDDFKTPENQSGIEIVGRVVSRLVLQKKIFEGNGPNTKTDQK